MQPGRADHRPARFHRLTASVYITGMLARRDRTDGFIGHLVAVEAKRQGLFPLLTDRRADPIEDLVEDLGLPARVLDLGDHHDSIVGGCSPAFILAVWDFCHARP
jgi:hypothetical protein